MIYAVKGYLKRAKKIIWRNFKRIIIKITNK